MGLHLQLPRAAPARARFRAMLAGVAAAFVFALHIADPAQAQDGEAEAASAARDCIAALQKSGDLCHVVTSCLSDYRAKFPQGPSRADLDALAGRLALGCAFAQDAKSFETTRACAVAAASACAATECYATYLHAFPMGGHAAEAREAGAARQQQCARESNGAAAAPSPSPPPAPAPSPSPAPSHEPGLLADGEYLADAAAVSACGIARQRLDISVCGGRVNWLHKAPLAANLPPAPLQWEGEIDANGDLGAGVRGNAGFAASGHVGATERRFDMRYPGCATPIPVTITGQLAAGCPKP